MTHRPYPNADRARRQVQRHEEESGPVVPAGLAAFGAALQAAATAVRRAQNARPDDYVLS